MEVEVICKDNAGMSVSSNPWSFNYNSQQPKSFLNNPIMKAVLVSADDAVIKDVPIPEPDDDEILIRSAPPELEISRFGR